MKFYKFFRLHETQVLHSVHRVQTVVSRNHAMQLSAFSCTCTYVVCYAGVGGEGRMTFFELNLPKSTDKRDTLRLAVHIDKFSQSTNNQLSLPKAQGPLLAHELFSACAKCKPLFTPVPSLTFPYHSFHPSDQMLLCGTRIF